MFKYISACNIANSVYEYEYIITDSNFETYVRTKVSPEAAKTNNRATRALAVIQEYSRRNLPVAKNLARLYRYLNNEAPNNNYILSHKIWFNKHYPEFNYNLKYYPCVIRELCLINQKIYV